MIVFQPVRPLEHKAALAQLREVLARRHNFNARDDKSTPEWDTVDDTKDIQTFGLALQVILGFIGMLTLGVGGVGVMNIMLVSVTERTKESDCGKRSGRVIAISHWQFLVEALVLTFVAGAVGCWSRSRWRTRFRRCRSTPLCTRRRITRATFS